ncbi:ArpU family phage packaging/lysis transcriptional regulator [Aneurinibacillus aneurinilyticus]|uniref:ArpU family phage packaging/lysis transcriptional regulator n=1 Tax=Aneurinibacillus aneurinilyticus TaxID=1391 RepID=UPI00352506E7
MQMSFLSKIDRKATQKRVEARIYKQSGFVRREMKNTPTYKARYHGARNKTTDTADCAVWNVNKEEETQVLTERVERAVGWLSRKEKEIIQLRYLEYRSFNYIVAGEVGLSERTYTRMKARVFYKLVFMLKLEIIVKETA